MVAGGDECLGYLSGRGRRKVGLDLFWCLVVCCFFFLFLGGGVIESSGLSNPRLKDGSYLVKEGTLLSQKWTVATLTFDVGEELYFPIVVPCFECFEKGDDYVTNSRGEVCVCDYSKKGKDCGKAPDGCPKDLCRKEDIETFCSASSLSDWTRVELKKEERRPKSEEAASPPGQKEIEENREVVRLHDLRLKQGETKYIRFLARDPCRGYKVKVLYNSGVVDVLWSTRVPEPNEDTQEWTTDARQYIDVTEIDMCPEYQGSRLGTQFITLIGRAKSSDFTLEIYSDPSTRDTPQAESNAPCEDMPDHTCVKMGVPFVIKDAPQQGQYFVRFDFLIKKGECKLVTASLQADQGDGGLAGSFTNPYPIYYVGENPPFQAEHGGSDLIFTQYCSQDDDSDEAHFYAAINTWAGAPSYTFRITTHKLPFFIKGTDLSPYQYGFSATGVLYADCPGPAAPLTWMCQDWKSYCSQMWLVYPSEGDPNPFWPPPAAWRSASSPVSAALFSKLTDYRVPVRESSNTSLSVVMVLENTLFGKETNYLSEDELLRCRFISQGTAFTKDGRALMGQARVLPSKERECKKDELKPIVEAGEKRLKELQKVEEFESTLRLAFEVDSIMFSTPWRNCEEKANSLLDSERVASKELSTACFHSNTSSTAYLNDPCCNVALSNSQCCIPRQETIEKTIRLGVNDTLVAGECQDADCIESYLKEWIILDQQDLRCTSFSSDEYPTLIQQASEFYRGCKERYNLDALALSQVSCTSDEQCSFGGEKNKCNLVSQTCIASRETELAAVRCIIKSMDLYTEYYFKEKLNLPGTKDSKEFFESLVKKVSKQDCRNDYGAQKSLVANQKFKVVSKTCASSRGCLDSLSSCLDTSCQILPNVCLTACQINWVEQTQDREECESVLKCNWKGDDCTDTTNCDAKCRNDAPSGSDSFCGYCFDDAHCLEIPGVNGKSTCENTEACFLPDGSIEFLSKKECEKRAACSQPCHDGFSCESARKADNLCVALDAVESKCNGLWNSELSLCVQPHLSQTICQATGFNWLSCKGLSISECEACYDGGAGCSVDQSMLQCHVVPRKECDSEKECESKGGWCSDANWYNTFGHVDDDFGTCIYPTATQTYAGVLPICYFGQMSPQGCFLPYPQSKRDCLAQPSTTWHQLARSEKECRADSGCDIYNQVLAFSPINEKNCKKCGRDTKRFFEWTQGKWIHGQSVKLQWQRRKVVPLYQWKSMIDFDLLYSILEESIQATVFADLRSQALCDFSGRSSILSVIGCSCSEDSGDNGNCFSSESKVVATGSGAACIGLGSNIQTAFSTLNIGKDATDIDSSERCVTVTVSYQSIYTVQRAAEQPFSPLLKIRDFDRYNVVRNKEGAIVGRVMSNGAEIELSGNLKAYEVCLLASEASGSPPDDFDTWDLGVTYDIDGEDFLKPLGLKLQWKVHNNSYCFEVESPKKTETYFLVARLKNWEKEEGSLYGTEAAAWWTFAALYTVLALLCMAIVVGHSLGYTLHFYFIGLFAFLCIMCVIRAVYFYLLGAEVFDEGSTLAVAYFLIEFPTLLYFTAFSCLASFWIFLIYAHMQSKGQRYILAACIAFNLLLYLMFVASLILYQTMPSSGDESACPSRLPTEEDNTRQQIVIITYQSVMAGVSILLALGVAIFGGKLLLGLKKRHFEGKIAMVTVVCAVGLLLHCAFILYLSVTLEYDFTIIVLMIVLSELMPIFIIAIQFSLLRFGAAGKLPSYNKQANFLRQLNPFRSKSSSESGPSVGTSTKSPITSGTFASTHSAAASQME